MIGKKEILFIALVTSFCMYNCNHINPKKSDRLTLYWKDKDYNIIREQQFTKDSIPDGFSKKYYPNGVLQHLCFYKKGKLDSVNKWYYDNGHIEQQYFYKEGLQNGAFSAYYSSGKIMTSYDYNSGKKRGSAYGYYDDGSIKTYQYFDNEGQLRFKRNYGKAGNIISEDGNGFIEVVSEQKPSQLSVGDTFVGNVIIITPPKEKRALLIYKGHPSQKETFVQQVELGNLPYYTFRCHCDKVDELYYHLALILGDSLTNKADTSYNINIKIKVSNKLNRES